MSGKDLRVNKVFGHPLLLSTLMDALLPGSSFLKIFLMCFCGYLSRTAVSEQTVRDTFPPRGSWVTVNCVPVHTHTRLLMKINFLSFAVTCAWEVITTIPASLHIYQFAVWIQCVVLATLILPLISSLFMIIKFRMFSFLIGSVIKYTGL